MKRPVILPVVGNGLQCTIDDLYMEVWSSNQLLGRDQPSALFMPGSYRTNMTPKASRSLLLSNSEIISIELYLIDAG